MSSSRRCRRLTCSPLWGAGVWLTLYRPNLIKCATCFTNRLSGHFLLFSTPVIVLADPWSILPHFPGCWGWFRRAQVLMDGSACCFDSLLYLWPRDAFLLPFIASSFCLYICNWMKDTLVTPACDWRQVWHTCYTEGLFSWQIVSEPFPPALVNSIVMACQFVLINRRFRFRFW